MEHPPTIFIAPEPPPFPAPPRSVDLSPLEFIFALIAVITIPALIYTFFFSVKCPPTSFRRRRSHSQSSFEEYSGGGVEQTPVENKDKDDKDSVLSDVTYKKETHVKEIGSECPVCLSGYSDGEEVKQLSQCKHSFHASCINKWLNSHSNCPVCRASVPVKRSPSTSASSRDHNTDLHQGLPDAANLV